MPFDIQHQAFACTHPVRLYLGLDVRDVIAKGFDPGLQALSGWHSCGYGDHVEAVPIHLLGVQGKLVGHHNYRGTLAHARIQPQTHTPGNGYPDVAVGYFICTQG